MGQTSGAFDGQLASLELGPDAVNMAGAARGALRISKALAVAGLLEGPHKSENQVGNMGNQESRGRTGKNAKTEGHGKEY